eukprot:TRINITY_DN3560_c0_g1_i1.p1 TRINITY_DN3560_c0_g1~~TRINITY_DN3560_c0_g1_i1.p1  ORF type:complete len:351 (+),score=72.11 TRINITY_DN3560_c0_g1_i1:137-1189(+)
MLHIKKDWLIHRPVCRKIMKLKQYKHQGLSPPPSPQKHKKENSAEKYEEKDKINIGNKMMYKCIIAMISVVVLGAAISGGIFFSMGNVDTTENLDDVEDSRKATTPNEKLLDAVLKGDLDGIFQLIQAAENLIQLLDSDIRYPPLEEIFGDVDNFTWAPLHAAALPIVPDQIMATLLSYAPRVDVANSKSFAPLHLAALFGNVTKSALLLRAGADVTAKATDRGIAPLHMAAKTAPELITLLLQFRADARDRDNAGSTPLHYAARGKCKECVRLLIDHDATSVNKIDDDGNSVLHLAVLAGDDNVDIAQLLLDGGADPTWKNPFDGCDAMCLAEKFAYEKLVQLFVAHAE